jgi:hypothetical protein
MHKEILEDLAKDCPCDKEKWCFIKELVLSSGFSDRQAEQARLVYDYKYMQSKEEKRDIGRERALKEFIAQYSEKFAKVYREGMKHDELFPKVLGVVPMPTDDEIKEHRKSEKEARIN